MVEDQESLRLPKDLTEEEFATELTELCQENAPRVFALCEVRPGHEDAWVGAWGMAFASGGATVFDEDGHARGRFDAADRACDFFAHRFFGERRDIRLVWVE